MNVSAPVAMQVASVEQIAASVSVQSLVASKSQFTP
jgi:hypothetical protein